MFLSRGIFFPDRELNKSWSLKHLGARGRIYLLFPWAQRMVRSSKLGFQFKFFLLRSLAFRSNMHFIIINKKNSLTASWTRTFLVKVTNSNLYTIWYSKVRLTCVNVLTRREAELYKCLVSVVLNSYFLAIFLSWEKTIFRPACEPGPCGWAPQILTARPSGIANVVCQV